MSRATMIDLPPEEEKADDIEPNEVEEIQQEHCLLYTSPSPRD